jgi:hypothetical protein
LTTSGRYTSTHIADSLVEHGLLNLEYLTELRSFSFKDVNYKSSYIPNHNGSAGAAFIHLLRTLRSPEIGTATWHLCQQPAEHIGSFQWMGLREVVQEIRARVMDKFSVSLVVQEGSNIRVEDDLKEILGSTLKKLQLENTFGLC